MPSRCYVSVPVWGQRYVDVFCSTALPALEQALLPIPNSVLVVHTDDAGRARVQASATQIQIEFRPVPAGFRDFDCLSQAHRDVLAMGVNDDVVVLLTADLVISSRGVLRVLEVLNHPQKRLVMCLGIRAVEEGQITGDLLEWAWAHRHPMTEECTYPDGRSNDLSRMYFQEGENVTARLCLPHPLGVKIDGRSLAFAPTIDVNLMQNFRQPEIHVETDSKDLALVELSPRDKAFQRNGRTIADALGERLVKVPDPLQRWCLSHRIAVIGDPDRMEIDKQQLGYLT